ncbi:MAG: nucleotidyltransferase domain-containing protein [Chloroflexi bacterium]|nr:nucleotidyltransferase domain-containing protein [Chloroflexota bacterium]
MLPALQKERKEILTIAARHGASNVRVIGAVARGEARADQDLDLLISLGSERSSFALGAIKAELEELLGCRVWLVTENGLSNELRESVLKEAVGL